MSDIITATDPACAPRDCTGMSALLDEPLLGTAPHAHAWLLVVHPGPWPAAAPDGLLDHVIADELARRCDEHRVRMVAIRGATHLADIGATACYLASTLPGRTWVRRLDLAEPKDLLDLDLGGAARGVAPQEGEPVHGPLYAVCTHGKRDACCASHGRPVQRALSLLAPGRAWETTHLGGHRFAANVLVLPDGLLYGRIDRNNVRTLVQAHARGAILPTLWRGRSAHPQPAQAAEWFTRHSADLPGIDDIEITALAREGRAWRVDLHAAGRRRTAWVERVATGCARLTGCTGTTADPGRWRLLELS